ncbi:hypothetical protein PRIPAC_81492 [Pristionchus pacificus]|uniref:Uncharacterized protein n=1 Tax=Pristionchus pacificus TaxID=54126 RepID=A0A2A6CPV1_PRIPA|nr:hypothetical protein PRIPAC_81492 [Pristionchus pacificus]|eukprot:PDM80126.1 hypothetical protein PRIPAC_32705 [Pristionchus pacificus]
MPAGLLRFPTIVFGKISNFMDNKSILELRQVCKATDKSLSAVAPTQPTVLQLEISKDLEGKSQLYLFFSRKLILWKLCLISVFRRLTIDPTTAMSQEHLTALCISLGWSDLKKFVVSAKYMLTADNIAIGLNKSSITNDMELEVIELYAELLQGKKLQSVSVTYPLTEHSQMKAWASFNKKVNSETALFQFEKLDKVSARCLIELSNNIDAITVSFRDHNSTTTHNIQSIIVEMLSRKCVKICIYSSPPFTLDNIEKLLQFANRCDKKIEISTNTPDENLPNFRYQIGVYEALISDGQLSITNFSQRIWLIEDFSSAVSRMHTIRALSLALLAAATLPQGCDEDAGARHPRHALHSRYRLSTMQEVPRNSRDPFRYGSKVITQHGRMLGTIARMREDGCSDCTGIQFQYNGGIRFTTPTNGKVIIPITCNADGTAWILDDSTITGAIQCTT